LPDEDTDATLLRVMPTNFFWFTADKIAGMECPGTYWPLERDLVFLKTKGIEIVVSLTLAPLKMKGSPQYEFEQFHIPLADGAAPTIPQIEQFVNYINYGLNSGKKILVHCGAGYGRTGTMFACYLVSLGYRARKAIIDVRKKRPNAIENKAQEQRIIEYEHYLKERRKKP
jgi:atypical dual specificity phosphatase